MEPGLYRQRRGQIHLNFSVKGVFHCVQNRQSSSRFFWELSGYSLWIFMSRAYCAWRNNQYILAAETVIINAACASAAFDIRHRHPHPLFSSAKQSVRSVTSILRHCQSRNTWPRLMNINFQSRFSTHCTTPLATLVAHLHNASKDNYYNNRTL